MATDVELSQDARHDLRGAAELFANYIAEATDNQFKIQLFGANEIVPGLKAADAVSNGSVEMCQTASYYYIGKDPTYCARDRRSLRLQCAPDQCLVLSWRRHRHDERVLRDAGHLRACRRQYRRADGRLVPQGDQDTGGFQGPQDAHRAALPGACSRSSARCRNCCAGDAIYEALEKGTIDAAEWVGPHDDEKLGFNKVAQYYYYPAWWEGGPALHFFINTDKWKSLPKSYQAIISAAAAAANIDMLAHYDALNPPAPEAPRRGGNAIAAVHDGYARRLPDGRPTSCLPRFRPANPTFKKIYDAQNGLPERRVSVVAGRRIWL